VRTIDETIAPRAIDVLPARATRRVTRRDGLLPLVFVVELLAGIAFGMAAHSGDSGASAVPAKLSLTPVAQVTPLAVSAPAYGPAIGPLRPGTVRPPTAAVATVQPPQHRHAPRNPFGALVHATS
jgi:hypothetical protein